MRSGSLVPESSGDGVIIVLDPEKREKRKDDRIDENVSVGGGQKPVMLRERRLGVECP